MNRNALLIGLLCLAATLIVIILVELLPDPAPREIVEASPGGAEVERPRPLVAGPDRSSLWVASLLKRPLFAANRRPSDEAGSKPQNQVDTGDDDQMRLAGIILAPGGAHAIFQGSGDAKPVSARIGDQVGAWTIEAIDGSGVSVTGPAGDQILRPKRDPAAEAEAAQAQNQAVIAAGQPNQGQPTPGQGVPGVLPPPNFPIGPRGIPSPLRPNGVMPQAGAPRKQNQ